MENDVLNTPIQQWLTKQRNTNAVRQINGLPIALASDIGLVRNENQDRVVLLKAQLSENKSFIVGALCDGMGGMSDGAICASIAMASFVSSCITYRRLNVKERLTKAVSIANERVYQQYQGDGGATLSAFLIDSDGHFEVVNIGDSRVYLIDEDRVKQITTDDTIAGKLLQHVGMGKDLEPHFITPSYHAKSKILLTSDGVHYIESKTLSDIVRQTIPSIDICQRIVNVANWCGGHDNGSVLLSELDGLFEDESQSASGSIQLWDPFDSCQIIAIEKKVEKQQAPQELAVQKRQSKVNKKVLTDSEPAFDVAASGHESAINKKPAAKRNQVNIEFK